MLAICLLAALGQTPQDSARSTSAVDELVKRLDSLERRNIQLEQQVSDLQSESGERWLTEERASEIRTIVADVVADADSRMSLQSDAMTAGWNDGFFLASPDGRFLLKLGGMLQTRFIYSYIPNDGRSGTNLFLDSDKNVSGFDLGQSELWFSGHVFSPDVTFGSRIQVANTNSVYLLDQNANVSGGSSSGALQVLEAWVRLALDDAWSIRAGQFRMAYSREFLVQEQYYTAVDRSVIDYHLGMGFTQGVELEYADAESRFRCSINDGAQDFTGGGLVSFAGGLDPLGKPWNYDGGALSFAARYEVKPWGGWDQFKSFTSPIGDESGLLLGVGAHWQQAQPYLYPNVDPPTDGLNYNTWMAVTVDATYMMGGASLFGSFYYNSIDSETAILNNSIGLSSDPTADLGTVGMYGAVVQGAYYFDTDVEGFARFEWGNYTVGQVPSAPAQWGQVLTPSNWLGIVTVGANWYIDGQDAKITTDLGYALTNVDPVWQTYPAGWRASGMNEFVFRTKFQLMF
ncbi:MAG: porin [Planctomycetota bacterium]|nr:porin [Planctomycetota bacterium]